MSFPRRRESRNKYNAIFCIILANSKNGTIYIGVTSNMIKIVSEHKEDLLEGFTKKYKVHNLVYYELTNMHSRRSLSPRRRGRE